MRMLPVVLTATISFTPAVSIAASIANETDSTQAYLQLHGLSYHTFRNGQNEKNTGLGYRSLDKESGTTWSIGGYINSYKNPSYYVTLGKSWFYSYIEYGFEYSLVTGYKDEKIKVAPLPVLGIGSVKLRIIPKTKPVYTLSIEIPIN